MDKLLKDVLLDCPLCEAGFPVVITASRFPSSGVALRVAASLALSGQSILIYQTEVDHKALAERIAESMEKERQMLEAAKASFAKAASAIAWQTTRETAYQKANTSAPFYDYHLNKGQRWKAPRKLRK